MNRRGVTLIELLIAVSLLSLLSLGMLMAMRVGLNAMEKANSKIIANRRAVAVQSILRREIDGFLPAAANCYNAPGQPPSRIVFFQGEPAAMRMVSTYSLEQAARGYPRVLEFAVIPGERGRGVRLIVNELPYTGPDSTGAACAGIFPDETGVARPRFQPIQSGPQSFVLADNLAFCRFSFLLSRQGEEDRWLPAWDGPQWPRAVRFDMAPLDPDPSRVPLVSVTAPIRITRRMGLNYAD